jgi:mono/diheme cytochrome c family protein
MLLAVATALADESAAMAAMADGTCTACHVVPAVQAPPRTESCAGCHAWVKTVSANPAAREKALAYFPKWERYERNVRSYFAVPDLAASAARLDPAWIGRYLQDPYDTRPSMPETMPRFDLSTAQIDAIVAWAAARSVPVAATPAPSAGNIERGAALFASRGCAACHGFGGIVEGAGLAAAPDLQHARDRVSNDMIVAWIVDPKAVSPAATMPAMGLSREEAIAVRDYLVLADARGAMPAAISAATPVTRAVTYDEVESRVIGKICVHCHMDPVQNEGRAGPGNAGGFGWAPSGLELQTYASVKANAARIVSALKRRHAEEARDHVQPGETPQAVARPALPGMPLGLPSITGEDLAVIEAWVAQGCPP